MGLSCCKSLEVNIRNQVPYFSPDKSPRLPGPCGLPCVGSLLEWNGPKTNLAWTKRYGSVYKVKMMSENMVYLNTIELVEEYLDGTEGESYLDRPMGPAAIGQGLLFGSGETWKNNKKAFKKALYTVTFAAHMEEAIQYEIQLTLDSLHDNLNKPIKLGDFLLSPCISVIPALLRGDSLSRDSQDREDLMKLARNLERIDLNSIMMKISLKYPKLRKLLSKLMFKEIVDVPGTSRGLGILLRSWIDDANASLLNPTAPRMDAAFTHQNFTQTEDSVTEGGSPFLEDSKRLKVTEKESKISEACSDIELGETIFCKEEVEPPLKKPPPSTPITEKAWTFKRKMSSNLKKESILQRILKQPEFAKATEGTDSELMQSLIDMFFGGVTSTLAALEYIFVHLVRNPDYQQLAHQEIDEVIAKNDGMITWSLKDDMPYVQACITEALRLGAVEPSSLPHVATKDTEIEGYIVPEGTLVLASIYSIHYDPAHYADPGMFKPQRHLTENGKYKPPTSFKPFGVGARKCVGDLMAKMQLFIYTVYILRYIELQPISNKSLPSLDSHIRIFHRLTDFRCILRKRCF